MSVIHVECNEKVARIWRLIKTGRDLQDFAGLRRISALWDVCRVAGPRGGQEAAKVWCLPDQWGHGKSWQDQCLKCVGCWFASEVLWEAKKAHCWRSLIFAVQAPPSSSVGVGAHLNLDMSRCRFGCFPLRSDALCKGMTWFLFAWCQISLLDYFQPGTCQQLVKDQKFIRKKERWFSFFLPLLTGVSYILLFPWIFLHSFCIFKVWTRGTRKQMDRGRVLRERWWKTRHEWNEVAWNIISWQVYFPDVYSTIKLCVRFNFCSLMLLTVLACCPARGLLMTFQEALSSACHGFVLKRLSVLTWLFNFWLKVLSAFSCMISLYCRGSR